MGLLNKLGKAAKKAFGESKDLAKDLKEKVSTKKILL